MTWRAGTVLRRTVGGVAYALGRVVVGGQGIADRTVNGNGHKQEKLHHPPVPLCRLVLTHAAGFCKELWSPVISEIETAITSPRLSVDQQQKPFTDTLAVDSVTSVLSPGTAVIVEWVALDFTGHGASSPPPPEPAHWDDYHVREVIEVMRDVGWSRSCADAGSGTHISVCTRCDGNSSAGAPGTNEPPHSDTAGNHMASFRCSCRNTSDHSVLNQTHAHAHIQHKHLGTCEDRSTHPCVIGVGHSMGGAVLTTLEMKPTCYPGTLDRVVAIEPPLFTRALSLAARGLSTVGANHLANAAMKRRRLWPDRDAVRTHVASRATHRRWDARAIDAWVKGGFREVVNQRGGHEVELCCSPEIEARCLRWPGTPISEMSTRNTVDSTGGCNTRVTLVVGRDSRFSPVGIPGTGQMCVLAHLSFVKCLKIIQRIVFLLCVEVVRIGASRVSCMRWWRCSLFSPFSHVYAFLCLRLFRSAAVLVSLTLQINPCTIWNIQPAYLYSIHTV